MVKRLILAIVVVLAVQTGAIAAGSTNAPVRELGIVRTYGDSAQIFDKTVNLADLDRGVGRFLLQTVENCRSNAAAHGKSPQSIASMGGNWLEYAVLLALKHHKLTPAYWQVQLRTVPNEFNDVLLWTAEYGPVVLSCKTSLRERYKQADLEAVALHAQYPQAQCFLITLDADKQHVARVRSKLKAGEIVALKGVYDEDNIDALFGFLKTLTLREPPPDTLRSGKTVR